MGHYDLTKRARANEGGHDITQRDRDLIEAREKPEQAEQQAADNSSGEAQSHIPYQAEPLALPGDDEAREAPAHQAHNDPDDELGERWHRSLPSFGLPHSQHRR